MIKLRQTFLTISLLLILAYSSPLMIEQKDEFLEKIKTKDIAVIFYGYSDTPEYQVFERLIPSYNQLFEGLEFLYVPANKFKLNRHNPSLSIYRNIGGGDWQIYQGSFSKQQMDKWIQKQTKDPLKELAIEQLESTFRKGEKAFILLSFGEFELLRTKIYLDDFCVYKGIDCWKVEPTSPIYSTVIQLLGVHKQDNHQILGISKLAFYNPNTKRLQLYTKDVWMLRREQLLEMFQGRKGIVHGDQSSNQAQIQIQIHYAEQTTSSPEDTL